jgi:hypothetical protein
MMDKKVAAINIVICITTGGLLSYFTATKWLAASGCSLACLSSAHWPSMKMLDQEDLITQISALMPHVTLLP